MMEILAAFFRLSYCARAAKMPVSWTDPASAATPVLGPIGPIPAPRLEFRSLSTVAVDNSVSNIVASGCKPRISAPGFKLMKK